MEKLVSSQPGILPHLTAKITHKRIWGATVFYVNPSDYYHVHLMTDLSGDPAIEAKQGFERKMVTYDLPVMQYHVDNESFNDISF